jgi:hypothetical protein
MLKKDNFNTIDRKILLLEEKNSYNKKIIFTQIAIILLLIIAILFIYFIFNKNK